MKTGKPLWSSPAPVPATNDEVNDNNSNTTSPLISKPKEPCPTPVPAILPTPSDHIALPKAIDFFAQFEQLYIAKRLDLFRMFALKGKIHSYHVCENHTNQKVLLVDEKCDNTLSYILGNLRPVKLIIKDTHAVELFYIIRPFAFTTKLFPLFRQEMQVLAPNGKHMGYVKQLSAAIKTMYAVSNASGERIFLIEGPRISSQIVNTFKPIKFRVTRPNNQSEEVGSIVKPTLGFFKSTFVSPVAYGFHVNFPESSTIEEKALLLSASLLVDFMHYG